MGDNNSTVPPGVTGWPPPGIRALSLAFGAGSVLAGFLGYCIPAAILALLSLIFNLWDLFQGRGSGRTGTGASKGEAGYSGTGASNPDRGDTYKP
jgi:hypothetical protein